MEARKPATIGLTVLAYVAATFGVQGASHFAVFAAHYAAIPIMRAEPVIAMGLGEDRDGNVTAGPFCGIRRDEPSDEPEQVLAAALLPAGLGSHCVKPSALIGQLPASRGGQSLDCRLIAALS